MSFARYIPLSVLLAVGLLAVTSVTVPVEKAPQRFETKDFAVLRARYLELQKIPGPARVELLKSTTQVCTQAVLSPVVIEKLQQFSRTIIESGEETEEARSAAKLLSQVLLNRKMEAWEATRRPASQKKW